MQLGLEHQVVGAVKSLQALDEAIEAELHSTKCWGLTTEGEEVSHTARRPMCFETSLLKAWCRVSVCDCPAARWASARLWIQTDSSAADGPWVYPVVGSIEDEVQRRLPLVQSGQAKKLADEERMCRGSC